MVDTGNRGFNAVYSEKDINREMAWNACRVSRSCGYSGGGIGDALMEIEHDNEWGIGYE